MCGIAGLFSSKHDAQFSSRAADEVQCMIQYIGYRGPDELRYFVDEHVALAAARLSIIDIALGHQPMADPTGRYWIAYNGEIYNHPEIRDLLVQRGYTFRTHCDTEVALYAWMEWGAKALARFDGGFAFVIYDRQEQTCSMVRDRSGKRPLFYIQHRGEVAFASEMKSFFACGGFKFKWDVDQLASIFTVWTPIGDQTGFEGIKQVPAGSVVTVGAGGLMVERYAAWPRRAGLEAGDLAKAESDARSLLNESVRKRLRSDVEVAVFVSGGLDSTIVTKLARDNLPGRIRTYSVRFDDLDYDETADQQEVAARYELDNCPVTIKSGTIADHFEAALWHAEIPQFRTAFVPMYLLARQVRADGIKVVLSGEGADEVFLGYDIFKETMLRANWANLDQAERRKRVGSLYPYLKHFSAANIAPLEALFARTSGRLEDPLYSHRIRFDNSNMARRLLRGDQSGLEALSQLADQNEVGRLTPLRRAQWLEFHTLLQGYLLSAQSDRMLFAHGVEPRCPFLAPEVIELAAGLPENFLLTADFQEKHLLKEAFRADLPARVLSKPKWPYRAPDATSFLASADAPPAWVGAVLSDESLRMVAPLDADLAGRLRDKVMTTKGPLSPSDNQAFVFLLSLVVLDELFVRRGGLARFGVPPRRIHRVAAAGDSITAYLQ